MLGDRAVRTAVATPAASWEKSVCASAVYAGTTVQDPPQPAATARGPPPPWLLHTDLPSHLGVARCTGGRPPRGAPSSGRRLVAPGLTRSSGAARTVHSGWCRRRRQRFPDTLDPLPGFPRRFPAHWQEAMAGVPRVAGPPRPCRADAV